MTAMSPKDVAVYFCKNEELYLIYNNRKLNNVKRRKIFGYMLYFV